MKIVLTESGERDPARVLILGEPGTGKTRLAGTFPDPLFIDIESDGATTARPVPTPRIVLPLSSNTVQDTIAAIKRLKSSKFENGAYQLETGPVRTLVIDPIDQIQRAAETKILGTKTTMQMRDWGTLLNTMYPIVLEWSGLPITVVVVGHVKVRGDDDARVKDAMLAVKGALRDELPGWFSLTLHVIAEEKAKRYVVKQPLTRGNIRYLAKDRHNLLKSLGDPESMLIDITSDTGWPDSTIADLVCGKEEDGGSKQGKGPAKDTP